MGAQRDEQTLIFLTRMIANRIRGMGLVHTGALALGSAVLFWTWLIVLFSITHGETRVDWSRYTVYCCVAVAGFGMDFVISRIRHTDLLNLDLAAAVRLTARQVLTILGCILFFLVAAKDQVMSRAFLFTLVPVLFGVLLLANRVLPAVMARFLFRARRRERVLLVGDLSGSERILLWCKSKAPYGVEVVGVVSDGLDRSNAGTPLLGTMAQFEDVVRTYGITQVVSMSLPKSVNRFARFAALCDRLGVRMLAVNDLERCFHRPISFFRDGGFQFISLREEPLECPLNRIVKRLIDVAIALPIVIFIMPPLSLLVWILHSLHSPGPLLFRQRRTGFGSGSFMIYKFRTMHVSHGSEAQQATTEDPRVFKFGRWLRKLSLDEIPQFLNVLNGEMSIVGPRPHMPEHDHLFAEVASSYHVRNLVKPGITGLAQVRGFRGETISTHDVVKRVEADVFYLENWSLLIEASIILRTAWQVFVPPRTAY
jgi:exopolysaccharide biosynthesis polyprenyl glycosylphosphotransferase